jgi:signal transduction histidine kinase
MAAMHRASDLRTGGPRRGALVAAVAAALAVALMAALLSWVFDASSARAGGIDAGPASGLAIALAWLAPAVVLAAVAAAAGAGIARHRADGALRDARLDRQALVDLLDVWQWQTDAEHRLLRLTPPSAAPAAAWSAAAPPLAPLWEHFDAGAPPPGPLRERLCAKVAVVDLPAARRDADGATTRWLLRGVPRFDGRGRFTGYLGTARPLDGGGRDAAALMQSLLAALPGPVAVGEVGADGRCSVLALNDAVRQLVGGARMPDWDALLARLPPALGAAARALSAGVPSPEGSAQRVDGWSLRLVRLHSGPDAPVWQVLALTPPADDDGAAAEAAREQESFSYTVSHDLRAPLRVVDGFARILKEDYGDALDKVGHDHLDRVLGAAARMNHMIDALLNLSQLSSRPLVRQPVNLSQLAGFVVDDLRRGAPDRHVDVHIEPGLRAQGDPTLLRMALENLLGNAWKYTARSAEPRIAFERTAHDGGVAYVVSDNGAGFDMRFADRLFGVFQRLHSASDFEGTGVGLASVRRIVQRHHGEIWAESEVGRGARFYFTLRG